LPLLIYNLNRGKKLPENVGYFCSFKKQPKINIDPLGENSPDVVTLLPIYQLKVFKLFLPVRRHVLETLFWASHSLKILGRPCSKSLRKIGSKQAFLFSNVHSLLFIRKWPFIDTHIHATD
jgi:hypothetical protein